MEIQLQRFIVKKVDRRACAPNRLNWKVEGVDRRAGRGGLGFCQLLFRSEGRRGPTTSREVGCALFAYEVKEYVRLLLWHYAEGGGTRPRNELDVESPGAKEGWPC